MSAAAPARRTPIPAATLILVRDRADGPPLILMAERAATLAFAGGALVFPGGRIEAADHALADRLAPDRPDAAARIAAIRETVEEVALAPAIAGRVPEDAPARLRGGEAFGTLLAAHDLRIDLDALIPWARWLPDLPHARVFDTLFYLARAPDGEPVADGTETASAFWMSAADVLDRVTAGQASAIFPTRRNLERLAAHDSFDALAAHARATPVRTISPWVERRGGHDHLCLPDDLGYPVTAERTETALRG